MNRTAIKPRQRKCAICKTSFMPFSSLEKWCSPNCGVEVAKQALAKERKTELKARREKLKSKADWTKEAQTQFNRFIRLRDHDLPCISCQRHHDGQYHAGHYKTTGAHPELRFEPLNCYKQCAPCNNHLSGNIIEMRKGIKERVGPIELAWIEGPHDAKNYTIEQLKDIKDFYRAQANLLQKRISE